MVPNSTRQSYQNAGDARAKIPFFRLPPAAQITDTTNAIRKPEPRSSKTTKTAYLSPLIDAADKADYLGHPQFEQDSRPVREMCLAQAYHSLSIPWNVQKK